jgi:hypothetical protein
MKRSIPRVVALAGLLLLCLSCGARREAVPAPVGEATTVTLKGNTCQVRVEAFGRDPVTGVAAKARATFVDLVGEFGWSSEFTHFKAAYLSEDAGMSVIQRTVPGENGAGPRTVLVVLFNARRELIRIIELPQAVPGPVVLSRTGRYAGAVGEQGTLFHMNTMTGAFKAHPLASAEREGLVLAPDDVGRMVASLRDGRRRTYRLDL